MSNTISLEQTQKALTVNYYLGELAFVEVITDPNARWSGQLRHNWKLINKDIIVRVF